MRKCRTSGSKTREWESSRHISHRANNSALKRSPFYAWIYSKKSPHDPLTGLKATPDGRGGLRGGLIRQWCLMAEFYGQKGGRLGDSHCRAGQFRKFSVKMRGLRDLSLCVPWSRNAICARCSLFAKRGASGYEATAYADLLMALLWREKALRLRPVRNFLMRSYPLPAGGEGLLRYRKLGKSKEGSELKIILYNSSSDNSAAPVNWSSY